MSTAVDERKPATLAQWKKAKTHLITLPSGTVIEIEIPDLPSLVKSGQIPNELIDTVIGIIERKKITREDILNQVDFYNKLVALAVKSPAVSEEDVAAGVIPFEDKEMIVEFATRQRDLDVLGHHLAGLEKVSDFRSFRGLSPSYEDVEGL